MSQNTLHLNLNGTLLEKLQNNHRHKNFIIYHQIKKQPEKSFHVLDTWVKKWPDNIEGHETLAEYYWNHNI